MKHSREFYAKGSSQERNDCAVRAFSVASCVSYKEAHKLYKAAGRKDKKATPPHLSSLVIRQEIPEAKHYLDYALKRITLKKFVEENPKGHFIVGVTCHALAICDGVVHDWQPGWRRIVRSYWQLV